MAYDPINKYRFNIPSTSLKVQMLQYNTKNIFIQKILTLDFHFYKNSKKILVILAQSLFGMKNLKKAEIKNLVQCFLNMKRLCKTLITE